MSRRVLDVLLSSAAILVCLPLWLVVAVAIKLDDGGPVFFRGVRVGRHGKRFTILKFRTMRNMSEPDGVGVTSSGDPRVTRLGRYLRRSKIDETPQFVNVLCGMMSLVGPRPENPRYLDTLPEDVRMGLLTVRPGIASPATVMFVREEEILANVEGDVERYYVREILPVKATLDLEYVENRSLGGDLRVCLAAIRAVVGKESQGR